MNEQEKAEHLEREIIGGQQAKLVLNGVKQHFTAYRAELFNAFSKSDYQEKEKRDEIYRQMKAIDTVEARLLKAITTGDFARDQLSRMQKLANKAKNIVGL